MNPSHDRTSSWSRQQRAVFEALLRTPGFVSAQALHLTMRTNGENIGLATVYRSLHALAASGRAETIQNAAGTQLFGAAAEGRQHRLACRDCRRRVPITATFVDDWATAIAAEHGFTDVHLVVEITGNCGTCSAPPRPRATGECCTRSACRC
ncbi:Fur family transcriptional regulator [Saccharopolyspora elongata]|uniref:Transcriptional repressor n=1 Tax=Saccharopolyspora elongata TaxID=2530387 RepID=A0A4R4XUA8_9PSEU|nr:transcriptional repressor [Saccharopolyspora elongata]